MPETTTPHYAPRIHMNGTNGAELQDQITAAQDAVHRAIDALAAAAPNARDYYPIGPDAYRDAARLHASQLARLFTVRDELYQTAETIADQL